MHETGPEESERERQAEPDLESGRVWAARPPQAAGAAAGVRRHVPGGAARGGDDDKLNGVRGAGQGGNSVGGDLLCVRLLARRFGGTFVRTDRDLVR